MEYVFTFTTTSLAIKAEQALLGAGLKITVMPLPSQIKAGCGLCLRVQKEDLQTARTLLREKEITNSEIYEKTKGPSGSIFTICA